MNGFTINANRYIGMTERSALEKLLAYGARGAFAHHRLTLLDPRDEAGDLVYTLKTVWSDGTEAIRPKSGERDRNLGLGGYGHQSAARKCAPSQSAGAFPGGK